MKLSNIGRTCFLIFLMLIPTATATVMGQVPSPRKSAFREQVEKRLGDHGLKLTDVCPIDEDAAARRIFVDYGAIFLSNADDRLPPRCIFENESEVADFQKGIETASAKIDSTTITLRKAAMESFLAARKEALKKGLDITPRGGMTASKRTFAETVKLWNSRFLPGLDHWISVGKITRKEADTARKASIAEQIEKVLEWEKNGLYFSKDFSKSILYSVAAPGASQHIFLLALDVEQYSNRSIRQILARHGWFQTVKSDLPHFTYLGMDEKDLPSFGLRSTSIGDQIFWVPDLD